MYLEFIFSHFNFNFNFNYNYNYNDFNYKDFIITLGSYEYFSYIPPN